MENTNSPRSKALKKQVKETQVYKALDFVQKEFIRRSQNIQVIERGLFIINDAGVKRWSEVTKYSPNNEEIIRELYANSLTITL